MKRFSALSIIATLFFADATAFAEPARSKVADGLVSFAVPDGWVHDKEPGFQIYIEPTLDDEDWSRCAVKAMDSLAPAGVNQETYNALMMRRTPHMSLKPGDQLISFSTSEVVGGSRVLAISYIGKGGPKFDVRQFAVFEGKTMTVIQADCVTAYPEAEDPKFVKGATLFLNSAAIHLN